MKLINLDLSRLFDVQKLVYDTETAWENEEAYRCKDGFVSVWKLVDGKNRIVLPFAICNYFGVTYNLKVDIEFIWEKVEDIKYQVLIELNNLMSNAIYKLDWNEDDNTSLYLFAFITSKSNQKHK